MELMSPRATTVSVSTTGPQPKGYRACHWISLTCPEPHPGATPAASGASCRACARGPSLRLLEAMAPRVQPLSSQL